MKYGLIVSICFFGYQGYSQEVVTDPTAYAYLAQNVQAAVDMADKAGKSLSMLEKAKNSIEKVSGAIHTLNIATTMVYNQEQIILRVRSCYNEMEQSKVFSARELGNMLQSLNYIVSLQQQNIKLATQILADDVFKMTDSERLKMLMDINSKTASSLNDVSILQNKYGQVKNKRTIQQTFR